MTHPGTVAHPSSPHQGLYRKCALKRVSLATCDTDSSCVAYCQRALLIQPIRAAVNMFASGFAAVRRPLSCLASSTTNLIQRLIRRVLENLTSRITSTTSVLGFYFLALLLQRATSCFLAQQQLSKKIALLATITSTLLKRSSERSGARITF